MLNERLLSQLTPAEREVAALCVKGLTNRQIGIARGTTEFVIKNYMKSIQEKLGVESKLQLAVMLVE